MSRRLLLVLAAMGYLVAAFMLVATGWRLAQGKHLVATVDLATVALNLWNAITFTRRLVKDRRPIAIPIDAGPHRSSTATACPTCGQPVAPRTP